MRALAIYALRHFGTVFLTASLKYSCDFTGIHFKFLKAGDTWSYFLMLQTILAAELWMPCSFLMLVWVVLAHCGWLALRVSQAMKTRLYMQLSHWRTLPLLPPVPPVPQPTPVVYQKKELLLSQFEQISSKHWSRAWRYWIRLHVFTTLIRLMVLTDWALGNKIFHFGIHEFYISWINSQS